MASLSEPNSPPSSPSLKQKLKSTLCLSSFQKHNQHHHRRHVTFHFSEKQMNQIHDHQVEQGVKNVESHEDIKGNKTSYLSCIGKHGYRNGHRHGQRRRHSMSADFRYDAMSYALNFDEGNGNGDSTHSNESPFMSFSSRLPSSPIRDIDICG